MTGEWLNLLLHMGAWGGYRISGEIKGQQTQDNGSSDTLCLPAHSDR